MAKILARLVCKKGARLSKCLLERHCKILRRVLACSSKKALQEFASLGKFFQENVRLHKIFKNEQDMNEQEMSDLK